MLKRCGHKTELSGALILQRQLNGKQLRAKPLNENHPGFAAVPEFLR